MPDDLHEGDTRALIQCLQRGYLAATQAVKDLTARAEKAEKAESALREALGWVDSGQYWRAREIIKDAMDGAEEADRGRS